MRVLPDFNLANNDNFGNRLRNIGVSFASFNYIGISNPSAAAPNYSGVINPGLGLSVVPGFRAPQFEDFSLMPNSMPVKLELRRARLPFKTSLGSLRDAQPDIGAFEFVATPVLKVRASPLSKGLGPKDQ